MTNLNRRQAERVRVSGQLNIRSVSLPGYGADILDISESGARVKLKGKAASTLLEDRIRFGVSLQSQMSPQFEGFARVAWLRQTENGLEAGLQWEKLTSDAWIRTQASLLLSEAA